MATKAPADSAQVERKSAVIDDITNRLQSAEASVLTEYRGLTVTALATLRAALRHAATDYKIYKNTLARRAAQEAGLTELAEWLEGPVAIAFVRPDGDAVTAAKALRDFARTNPNLVVKGGMLGPRMLTVKDIEALADVPPRDQLLARLAGGFQAPLTKAAGLFQAFTRNFAYGLKAYIDTRPVEESRSATAPTGAQDEGESDLQAPPSAASEESPEQESAADTETNESAETPEQEPAATETQEEEAN
jgi:large subunit ribosomal protein L10